jgi:hypothetical protein
MGRLGEITRIERTDIDGDKVALLTVDFGGGDVITAPYIPQPQDDGLPIEGDTALVVELEGDPGEYMALAVLDVTFDGVAGKGERVIRSRDGDGATIATVWLKADGAVKIDNDSGYIELKADGQANINGRFTVDP